MNSKDITKEWIRINFNIDKERQYKKVVVHSDDIYFEASNIESLFQHLAAQAESFQKKYNIENINDIKMEDDTYYDHRNINFSAQVSIPETDEEVINRLQKQVKKEIRDRKKEEKEKELYGLRNIA